MQFLEGSSSTFPVWLKIDRTGNQFTGSMSQDGRVWQVVGSTNVAMAEVIMAGLAVTSHDTAVNTSSFDHVLEASAVPLPGDVGDVGIADTVDTETNSTAFSVQGGGADVRESRSDDPGRARSVGRARHARRHAVGSG